MEKSTSETAKHSGPLMRLIKTKLLNIVIAVIVVICLILFMREGSSPEGNLKVVDIGRGQSQKNADKPKERMVDSPQNTEVEIPQAVEEEQDGVDMDYDVAMKEDLVDKQKNEQLTTTPAEITTTPFVTTAGIKVKLNQDSSKASIHTDFLKVAGYNVGTVRLDHLNNYRNPCFFEETESTNVVQMGVTYNNNKFRKIEPFAQHFDYLSKMIIRSHEELCGERQGCRLRCLPYFMVVGVAEKETMHFYEQLTQHPQVKPPIVPEISFWNKYRFMDTNLNDYLDLYDNATSEIHKKAITSDSTGKHIYLDITGELSSIAMMADHNWRKDPRNEDLNEPFILLSHDLHEVIPNLKFVMLLREPVSHIYWHYNNAPYGKNKSAEEFHTRVNNSITWWADCLAVHPQRACAYGIPSDMEQFEDRTNNTWWPKSSHFIGALRDGLYWIYITDYLKVFPRDSFLFIRAEDYIDNPKEILTKQVFPFLDISVNEMQMFEQSLNITEQDLYKPMLPSTRKLLEDFYEGYNDKLSDLLQDKRFSWEDTNDRIYRKNM